MKNEVEKVFENVIPSAERRKAQNARFILRGQPIAYHPQ